MAAREPDAPAATRRHPPHHPRPRSTTRCSRCAPTTVVGGRTEPAQWGEGTRLVPASHPFEVAVFLYVRGLRAGSARTTVLPEHERVTYRAPWLPLLPGRLTVS
ncbi:hypothetical protein [Salinibacterium sp. ZJ70]|uniref:hypothetical protein n=1 Tax=Salinibacterium sp. ZJ70 TaxID=2708084 RepID=UPI0014203EEC|nr:hypothetical protein [Salinibacterium sp. ZJ70]